MMNNLKSNLPLPCSVMGALHSEEQYNVILVILRAFISWPTQIQVCIKVVATFSASQIQDQNSILNHLGLCVWTCSLSEHFVSCLGAHWAYCG